MNSPIHYTTTASQQALVCSYWRGSSVYRTYSPPTPCDRSINLL